MPDSRDDLRKLFGKAADCIPAEGIAAIAQSPNGAVSNPLWRSHLNSCAYCQSEVALLREFESLAPRPEESATVEWIEGELRRRVSIPGAPDRLRGGSNWERINSWLAGGFPAARWRAAGIAFASLAVVVWGGLYLRNSSSTSERRDANAPIVWRSAQVRVVAPVGEIKEAPAELRWMEVAGVAQYQVHVFEVDRHEIWSTQTLEPVIGIPEEIRRQMTSGRTFLWQVVAKNSTGSEIAQSNLQSFHIAMTNR